MNQESSEDMIKELFGSTEINISVDGVKATDTGIAPMVMIVEDDADIACSLTIRLKTQGFRTCLASDAPAALAVARENEPDCAILDINMPGGDGFEVAEQLRKEPCTLGIPIIFLTASMRPDLREKAEAAGAAGFMTKPYDAGKLLANIRELIAGGRFQGE